MLGALHASIASFALALGAPAAERPNVVFVLADDLGLGDLGCYNPRSRIPTPELDQLAKEGLRFTDAHSPSSVCSPTRYGLLTGRYAWRTALKQGVLWGDSPLLVEPERSTVASFLRSQGYATACIGKWHLGLGRPPVTDWSKPLRPGPLELGFERFFGFAGSLDMQPYVYVDGDRPLEPATRWIERGLSRREGGDGFWREGPIAEGFVHEEALRRFVDEGIAFIEACAGAPEPKPFFLFLSLTAPHTPWVPEEEYQGKSGAGWYGDFVAQIDAEVGRVLDVLARAELTEETLVIFTSDNGAHWTEADALQHAHAANGELRGQKGDAWEGGHRVPFLARWPEHVPAGAVEDELLCLVDLYATLAGLLDVELPAEDAPDSFDLSPALLGKELEAPCRPALVLHSFDGMFALRAGDWKLIEGLGSGGFSDPYLVPPVEGGPAGQLYDLRSDPGERANRWLAEPERVERLSALLDEARRNRRTRPGE